MMRANEMMSTEVLANTSITLRIKHLIKMVRETAYLLLGFAYYVVMGKTFERSWQATVFLFCHTGGRSNHWVHSIVKAFNRPLPPKAASGFLGNLSNDKIQGIVDELEEKGYYVCEQRLPAELCDALLNYSLETNYGHLNDKKVEGDLRFNRQKPIAIKYQVAEADLVNNALIQKVISDRSFLEVARRYLGCEPRADQVGLWWTTAFSKEPDPYAATMYHFDMSRMRWLNVFINLTDVGPENGPHTFIEGSHKVDGIPAHFLRRGYVRISDREVEECYGKAKVKEFSGPRGTIILEDTIGLHKGKPVFQGDRLMFQISYVDCLFGGERLQAKLQPEEPALKELIKDNPRLFARYM